MKYITILNIIIRSVFVVLTFFCIRKAEDYILVPLLLAIGYFIGGMIALYIIFFHDRLSCLHGRICSIILRMLLLYFVRM